MERNDDAPWGAKINLDHDYDGQDCPAWATPVQRRRRQTWGEVVLWNRRRRQIIGLHACEALRVLEQLRTTKSWRKQGVVVGGPTLDLMPDDAGELHFQSANEEMQLTGAQAEELLGLLEQHEERLQHMEWSARELMLLFDRLASIGRAVREARDRDVSRSADDRVTAGDWNDHDM
jgi:hypothetical protein